MTPTDIYRHLASAYMFLLRLPLPNAKTVAPLSADALWACVPIGLVVGTILAGMAAILLALGLPERLVAWSLIGMAAAMSGALHEDALADVLDGFFGGHDATSRLKIMKDSAVGTFAVLGLVVIKSAEAELLTYILRSDGGLVFIAAMAGISRGFWGLSLRFIAAVKTAEGSLAHSLGEVKDSMIIGSLVIVAGMIFLSMPIISGILLMATLSGFCILWSLWCRQKIGGVNGDCLGAMQQCNMILGSVIFIIGGFL